MKNRLLIMLGLVLVLGACQKEKKDNTYLIDKNRIGNLTKDIQVYQLDSVFAGDSVVNKNNSKEFSRGNEIVVYQKGGKPLLRLYPAKSFDSTSTISGVEVIDTIFKTDKGLGKGSRFEVLKTNYSISRIENTLGTAMVFVDDLNMYVNIDKKDILEPTGMGVKIKSSQIKNGAVIRHLWLDWEKNED